MDESELQAQVSAASAYERLFVPALFGQWARRVADTADLGPGDRVLDVACGTGVLAREAAPRITPDGSVAGLDINRGMLTVAAQLAPHIDWRHGDAGKLPFADASFEAVISQFGLMFFPDRSQSLREMMRVLVPDGRLAIAVFDSLENQPAYALEVELLRNTAGRDAANALRAPFALGDRHDLAELFRSAGIIQPKITTHPGMARFQSIRSMVEADLRGWLPVMGVELAADVIAEVLEKAETVLNRFADPRGAIAFDLSAHIVSATKR